MILQHYTSTMLKVLSESWPIIKETNIMVYFCCNLYQFYKNHGYISPTNICMYHLMSKTCFVTAKYVIKLSKVCGGSCINCETKVKVLFILWQGKGCRFYSIMESKARTPTSVVVLNSCYGNFFQALSVHYPILFLRWNAVHIFKTFYWGIIYIQKSMP